ncbi:uncharacterized protein LOC128667040 isoform X1 [Bombina bombina]|uniref:uncharacterized protein LOC128667040 isoform X1 n=1 Tax=Bombina bombina TaxID=8345 RepID=UPI00235ADEBB|nr:uncharacterized protein LOC128667040 isoform X1 [Bombina bombina]
MSVETSGTSAESEARESSRKRKSSKPKKATGGIRRPLQKIDDSNKEVLANSRELQEDSSKKAGNQDASPQKNQQHQNRARGRPKGSTNKYPSWVALLAAAQPDRENEQKRPRGRPKGSLNKNPSRSALKALQQEASGEEKRGRGRPKKIVDPNCIVTPKKGRGRPKGSLNKIQSIKKKIERTGIRKRGRPSLSKRPRGRPKLSAISGDQTTSEARLDESSADLNQSKSGEAVKKGRGRPKKLSPEDFEPVLKKAKHSGIGRKSSQQMKSSDQNDDEDVEDDIN